MHRAAVSPDHRVGAEGHERCSESRRLTDEPMRGLQVNIIQTTMARASRARMLVFPLFLVLAMGAGGCQSHQTKPVRIGILMFGNVRKPQVEGFIKGMRALGYQRGKSVVYLIRNAHHHRKKMPGLVRGLIQAKVNLLVGAGGLEADTLKSVASSSHIPVVILYVNAIMVRGLVQSRRHPGWAVTGVDNLDAQISGKRVELLHDLVPAIHRILVLYYPNIDPSRIGMETARRAARKEGLVIDARAVHSLADIRRVMDGLKPGEDDAMLTVPTAQIDNALKKIILPQVRRLRLPLMTHSRLMVQEGALASYCAPSYNLGYQAARLAYKVLNGVKPQNIPFETPKKFVYTINRDALARLHLTLNPQAQTQVDEIISTTR